MVRVVEIDHVDHAVPRPKQRNVIVADPAHRFIYKNIVVPQLGSDSPDTLHNLRRALNRVALLEDPQVLVADHVPHYAEDGSVPGIGWILREVGRADQNVGCTLVELPPILTVHKEKIDTERRRRLFESIAERHEKANA